MTVAEAVANWTAWMPYFVAGSDVEHAQEVAVLDADSHCGELIVNLLTQANELVALMDESDVVSDVSAACVVQANVWYFG